jgi:putative ubiquitin-RnfH superfamily antitoxin RatB of RatAB toxin-antitoxin module
MAEQAAVLRVQICYVSPTAQVLRDLMVSEGTTLYEAIASSGIIQEIAEIDLTAGRVGIHGKLKPLDTVLRDQDRIEIYRPLLADPKEARRKRAVSDGAAKSGRP